MSHRSYDLNLGSEILILGGDIRSRTWPNIGGTYGTVQFEFHEKKARGCSKVMVDFTKNLF